MPDLTHVITHLEQHTARTAGNPEMHGQFTTALEILKGEHEDPNAEKPVHQLGDAPADPNDQEPSDE